MSDSHQLILDLFGPLGEHNADHNVRQSHGWVNVALKDNETCQPARADGRATRMAGREAPLQEFAEEQLAIAAAYVALVG